jgi:hypothetical protein
MRPGAPSTGAPGPVPSQRPRPRRNSGPFGPAATGQQPVTPGAAAQPPAAPPQAPPTGPQAPAPGGRAERNSGPGRRPSRPVKRPATGPQSRTGPFKKLNSDAGPGRRGANMVLAVALLAVAAAGAGLATRLPGTGRTTAAAAPEPYTSRWLCPVLPTSDAKVTVVNAGKTPAVLRASLSGVEEDAAGANEAATPVKELPAGDSLAVGASREIPVETKIPSLLQVESFGAPVAASAAGQPGCSPEASDRWWFTAADTSSGTVNLVLANPGAEGAVAQVVLHTATEPYRPDKLRKLFIPGHSAIVRKLNEFSPQLQMSVEVQSLLGRVVAGAVSTPGNAKPGAKGTVVLPGQPGSQAAWSFAGGLGGKGDKTTLAVANPSLDPIVVDVRAITGKDAFTPSGVEDLEIPSGAIKRVELQVNNAPGSGAMGVEVRSRTGSRFAAALVVQPKPGGGDAYVDAGTGRGWDRWVLPAATGKSQVVLANLGNTDVTARLSDLGRPGDAGVEVKVPAGRAVVKDVSGTKSGLLVQAAQGALVVQGDKGVAIPAAAVGSVDLRGPVVPGPAAG